jgi:nucleoside triphosphate diphosphatase
MERILSMAAQPPETRGIDRLLAIMARLRDPANGCPWDLGQDWRSIAPYTIEEAYEVAEAIETDDPALIKDELGDLLFQIVFQARIAEERAVFTFDDVAGHCADKMVRRHPHIFGESSESDSTASGGQSAWETLKAAERAAKADRTGTPASALDGVTVSLPGLTRAVKIQSRAARVGFDWATARPILDKIMEEINELRAELAAGAPRDRVEDELGDLLFTVANLARRLDLDAETALRRATGKFERRFRGMERLLAERGERIENQPAETLDRMWHTVKADEAL